MKMLIGLVIALSFLASKAVGFDSNTLITVASGRLKPIKEINIGDTVVCYNKKFEQVHGVVKGVCAYTVDSTVRIVTQDNVEMVVSHLERFFLPHEGAWVCAQNLKVGDSLLNDDLERVNITIIQQFYEPQELYAITVDKYHNFLASEGKYLVHNGLLAAQQAYWATKIAAYAVLGVAVSGAVAATGGAVVTAASAVAAGTATTTTVVTAVGAGIANSAITTAACGSTTSALLVGGATTAATVVGGVEAGVTAGIYATGAASIITVSGAPAATVGTAGVCASTAAGIEAAATAAYFVALTCPYTPW